MKHFTLCERMRQIALALTVVFVLFTMMSVADFAGAKNSLKFRDISQAGWALWVFIILGSIIILLQLIPAVILFFSLVGGGVKAAHNGVAVKEPCCAKETVKEDV